MPVPNSSGPVRLVLWRLESVIDETPVAIVELVEGRTRPPSIAFGTDVYVQDPRNADRYEFKEK